MMRLFLLRPRCGDPQGVPDARVPHVPVPAGAFNGRNHPNWGMPNLNLSGAARPGLSSTAAHAKFPGRHQHGQRHAAAPVGPEVLILRRPHWRWSAVRFTK
jgi:hypothetical protein